jgi:hypothetical protein
MRARRPSRSEIALVVLGGVAAGGLAVGLAVLFGTWAPGEGPDVGPTAATLDEAFLELLGAAVGLGVGAAVVAARATAPVRAALAAGTVGFVAVVLPVFAATAPSDVSGGETASAAGLLALLLTPAVLAGAALGAGYRNARHRRRA